MPGKSFTYRRLEREDLVSVLLGEVPPTSDYLPGSTYGAKGGMVAVYRREQKQGAPIALLVENSNIDQLFSWVETYAPQFSPLTQFCRVLSFDDERYVYDDLRHVNNFDQIRSFAGIVIGEVIAQSGGDPIRALQTASVSTAQSTYTFPVARQASIWSSVSSVSKLKSEFDQLRKNGVLSARRLDVSSLELLWSLASRNEPSNLKERWMVLLENAVFEIRGSGTLSTSSALALAGFFEPAGELIGLGKKSAEERVQSLDRILSSTHLNEDVASRNIELFCLAYAAVEIGGGTTRHMGLLVDVGEKHPLIWPWFGFLASIGSDLKWDGLFARFGRLVERELSFSFVAGDLPRSDVSIRELWACGGNKPAAWLSGIPRMQSRTVVLEFLPGVSIHLPIATDALNRDVGGGSIIAPPLPLPPPPDLTILDDALERLWAYRQTLLGVGDKPAKNVTSNQKKRPAKSSKPKSGLF